MDFPVAPGEKYALIALDAGVAELGGPLVLGDGYLAVPPGVFDLPPHWKEWLGTVRTEAIERASLVLMAKAASDRLTVLDGENQHLQQGVSNLYWGLLASGKVRMSGAGTQLTGSHGEDGINVRQVGDLDHIISVSGLLTEPVTKVHLRRAAHLAARLGYLFTDPKMLRMRMAVNAFLRALSERLPSERVHQFVRVVDGLTRVTRRGRDRFKERCRIFVRPENVESCYELYVIRSNVEHFQEPSQDLPVLPRRDDILRGYQRTHEAEALARYCMAHLLENKDLWRNFADDQVDTFWARPEQERAAMWGAPLDLGAALAGFRPDHVPDE